MSCFDGTIEFSRDEEREEWADKERREKETREERRGDDDDDEMRVRKKRMYEAPMKHE